MSLLTRLYEDSDRDNKDALNKYAHASEAYELIKQECKKKLNDAEMEFKKAKEEYLKAISKK
jgi:hypothetical protein